MHPQNLQISRERTRHLQTNPAKRKGFQARPNENREMTETGEERGERRERREERGERTEERGERREERGEEREESREER